MKNSALLLTDGLLDKIQCKTAHGLLHGPSRFEIVGLIDKKFSGQILSNIVTGVKNLPVFSTIEEALKNLNYKPDFCIIGVAPSGGILSASLKETVVTAINEKMSVVNGLHTLLNEDVQLQELAKQNQIEMIDIRQEKHHSQLQMWSGKITKITVPRVAVLGTDCAIGKRTTANMLLALCQQNQIQAEMIYTGQTGWLQGRKYGFILDTTLNDYVSGEMEQSILNCIAYENPQVIFIEGQSALRNPAGPCGAELLCSAGAKYVVLQHSPGREYYCTDPTHTFPIPSVENEIELIRYYGAQVIAITLNSSDIPSSELSRIKKEIQEKTNLPVVYPKIDGVESLLPCLQDIIAKVIA